MAEIVTPRGIAVPGRIVPAPVESRVLIVQLLVASGPGNTDYATTPAMGNRVRLLSIDVWYQPATQGGFITGYLKLTTGFGVAGSADVVSLEWDSIMDTSMLMKVGMLIFCCDLHLRFDMHKLYIGESRRFGIFSESSCAKQYSILGAFHIAEG